jgi:hypothetical protein
MNRFLNIFCFACLLLFTQRIQLSAQELHPELLKPLQPESNILFESRNGFKLPSTGVIRLLIVFAEYDYLNGGDPTSPQGTAGWPAHSLPTWADDLTDVLSPSGSARGVITRYYQMASSGNYTVLGDYLLAPDNGGIFKVQTESAQSVEPDNQELMAVVNQKTGGNFITAHGLNNISYFDLWTCPDNEYGLPKATPGNENPGKYDHVVFIWRNSAFNGIGNYSYFSPGKMFGNEANTYSWFGAHDKVPTQIMVHEYAHLIYGGLDFHCGGGGWFTGGDYWIPAIGGWSNLGLSGSSLLSWNAWDRLRLDWKAPGNIYSISARNESNTEEKNGDLEAANPSQSGIYTLRDFVTTGDALRIKLPFIDPEKEFPEYLWLENHNTFSMNQCQWDRFLYEEGNSCIQPAVYGLYAYMQVDRETRQGTTFDEVFKGYANYLRPITAEGFYDKEFEAVAIPNTCIGSMAMYPFNRLPENVNPLTGSGDQEYYAVDWNQDNVLDHSDQFYTSIENINGTYYKNMFNNGHSRNSFTLSGNYKIGIGTNPASATLMNMVGYDTPVEGAKNIRKVYLNGVSAEILNQNPDGTMQVQIRFDDVDVNNDVRWCADEIVLNPVLSPSGYSLNLKAGKTITLDQGTTATRMTDPVMFNNRMIYASPTVFTIEPDAKMRLETDSKIVLRNASTLKMKPGSSCVIEDGGLMELESGTTLIIENGGSLSINGKGKLVARSGSTLCISSTAILSLQNGLNNLEIDPGAIIPTGCNDPTEDSGVRVSPNPATTSISFDFVLPPGINSTELIISDALGRIVDRLLLSGKRGQELLDTSTYSSGMYFFRSGEYENLSGKFIIR